MTKVFTVSNWWSMNWLPPIVISPPETPLAPPPGRTRRPAALELNVEVSPIPVRVAVPLKVSVLTAWVPKAWGPVIPTLALVEIARYRPPLSSADVIGRKPPLEE